MTLAAIDELSPTALKNVFDLDRDVFDLGDALTMDQGTFASPGYFRYGGTTNNTSLTHSWRFRQLYLRRWADPALKSSLEASTIGDMVVNLRARLTGTPNTAAALDIVAFVSNLQGGTTGSDICTTAPISLLAAGANNWATYSFTIAGATLARGGTILIYGQATNDDTGGSGGGRFELGDAYLTMQER